jgi:hypothetical protein
MRWRSSNACTICGEGKMPRPLTIEEVNDLRQEALETREMVEILERMRKDLPEDQPPAKEQNDPPMPAAAGDEDETPLERPRKRRKLTQDHEPEVGEEEREDEPGTPIPVSFSESLPDEQFTTTINDAEPKVKRFTMMLWNVESYGSFKADANPWANLLIRQVIDELDVDLSLFLESKGAPADVVAAIEHVKQGELATSRQKKQTGGMDITSKRRFTAAEKRELTDEEELRSDPEAFQARMQELAGDDPVYFFPITSATTGKVAGLPAMIGAYLPRKHRATNLPRFKKHFSYVGTRLEPSWVSYLRELIVLYDLRLRKADAEPDSYDLDDFGPPLTDVELRDLESAVRALCFDTADLEDLNTRGEFFTFDAASVASRREYIDSIIASLLKSGVAEDAPEIAYLRQLREEQPSDDPRADRRDRKQWGTDFKAWLKDTKEWRVELLQRLEESLLFVLRQTPDCPTCSRGLGGPAPGKNQPPPSSGTTQRKSPGPQPPRPVIGLRNEWNTCYVNAALQLALRMGLGQDATLQALQDSAQRYAGTAVEADVSAAALAFQLLDGLRKQAAAGTYNSVLPITGNRPQGPEAIYLNGGTEALRRHFLGRGLIAALAGRNDDAAVILDSLTTGFARPPRVLDANGTTVVIQGINTSPDRLRQNYGVEVPDPVELQSAFHYVVRIRKSYRLTVQRIVDARLHTLVLDAEYRRTEYEARGSLMLAFPPFQSEEERRSRQFELRELMERFADLDTSLDTGTEATCLVANVPVIAALAREETALVGPPPARLLVQLKRFVYSRESNRMDKIDNAVAVPEICKFFGFDYQLAAFAVHTGAEMTKGHYIAYAEYGDRWFELNDMTVTPDPEGRREHRNHGYLYYFIRMDVPSGMAK